MNFRPAEKIGTGKYVCTDREKQYITDVLNSGRLTYGNYSKKFESMFAKIHQCKFAVLSNSGTSSLQVALHCLKEHGAWNDGDEVICPATTFVASSNIILNNNLKPVFVEVDPIYYELDATKLEEAITEKTKCIIVVHLFGQPCDMDPILDIANKYNLKIIEDSCETMFAKYKGKSVGSFGDIACFSSYNAHILTTGVGGLSTTNNKEYAVIMRSLVNHGRDNIYIAYDDDAGKKGEELKEIIEKRFQFTRCGYSYRITELEAALGVAQLESWRDIIDRRVEIAKYYTTKLAKYCEYLQLPQIRPDNDHAFMMYPILIINDKIKKEDFTQFLEENLIETRDMLPLINQPCYKHIIDRTKFPVSEILIQKGFFVGCHPHMTQEEVDYVVCKIEQFMEFNPVHKHFIKNIVLAKLYFSRITQIFFIK